MRHEAEGASMSEWWSYRPSDFLMFSPRIYWRLFASINEAFWPAQPALIVLGLAWLARARAQRLAAGALAITSAVVAWAFLWQRFAPINWPAQYFALAFALQAVVLSTLTVGGGLHASDSAWRRRAGIALIAWALLGHPLLAPAFGRPWSQAEVFGLAPDPTAIATLGWLLVVEAGGAARIALRICGLLAALWLAAAAAMLAVMGSWQAIVPFAALAASWLARNGRTRWFRAISGVSSRSCRARSPGT
jgi:hypothetical protein